ncbi:MAG: cation transporter [Caldilineaceae bacterium]|nr:cation transporter [Caldilineaceae bacterium]
MASSKQERPIAVYGAIGANLLVAITKFVAAFFSGSSSMLSEGIHSVVDTGNQLLLLLGIRRARKPSDKQHPFGYGQELYFWSLIVAILLFGLGGGMSVYEGVTHLTHPSALEDPLWNYVVLGLAFLFEGTSFTIAFRELRAERRDESIWQAIRNSKDPTTFVVVFEDSAALLGLVTAFIGVFLSHRLSNPRLDGVASLIIGLLLATVAVLLAYESRGLLLGESFDPEKVEEIRQLVEADEQVVRAGRPLTMHLGPEDVLLNLDVQFRTDLSNRELAATVDRLEKTIRQRYAEVKRIFIEVEVFTEASTTVSAGNEP